MSDEAHEVPPFDLHVSDAAALLVRSLKVKYNGSVFVEINVRLTDLPTSYAIRATIPEQMRGTDRGDAPTALCPCGVPHIRPGQTMSADAATYQCKYGAMHWVLAPRVLP